MNAALQVERTAAGTAGRRVIVCGGRDFRDRDMMYAALDAFHALDPIAVVIEGGQRTTDAETREVVGGADFWAMQWAYSRGISCHTEFAQWREHGNAAGPKRNAKMLTMSPDLVIAFPGGTGTADMERRAEAAGVPVAHVVDLG